MQNTNYRFGVLVILLLRPFFPVPMRRDNLMSKLSRDRPEPACTLQSINSSLTPIFSNFFCQNLRLHKGKAAKTSLRLAKLYVVVERR